MDVYKAAVNEALEKLRESYKAAKGKKANTLGCVLGKWKRIAKRLETALVNHKWDVARIPIECGSYAVYLRFVFENGIPHFDSLAVGPRSGWPYRWVIRIEGRKVTLVENRKKVKATPVQ